MASCCDLKIERCYFVLQWVSLHGCSLLRPLHPALAGGITGAHSPAGRDPPFQETPFALGAEPDTGLVGIT